MTREDVVAWCRRAPDRGTAKHEEFVDYVTLIERRSRVGNRWVTREVPYMSVDGRLAMANMDHQRQDKKLIFHDPVVLADTDQHVTLMVLVESELYGRRHGIATSRKTDGSSIETQHPWEIAETSAIGRALSAMGYGLLPGSGDYSNSGATDEPANNHAESGASRTLSARQREYLVDAAAETLALSLPDAARYVNRLCQVRFSHPLQDCTRDEGKALALELRRPSEAATDAADVAVASRQEA